ncbi:MAG: regulatory protein RecX [Gemmatimonadota bacterium]|nr:regulatory protein RecX [Gemmatimonadota bacterium]
MPSACVPRITRAEPLGTRGLRVRVHLDRGEAFEVALEAVERTGLGVGDDLPPARHRELLDVDADVRIREAALNLISYRARGRVELERKLRRKGFGPERVEGCVARLEERGLVDDAAVAAAFVRDRLRHRPKGRVQLTSELRAKGIAAETAEDVVHEVFEAEETTDSVLAAEVAEGWVARQNPDLLRSLVDEEWTRDRERAERRLRSYLGRRGFRGDALRLGLERAREAAEERA